MYTGLHGNCKNDTRVHREKQPLFSSISGTSGRASAEGVHEGIPPLGRFDQAFIRFRAGPPRHVSCRLDGRRAAWVPMGASMLSGVEGAAPTGDVPADAPVGPSLTAGPSCR